MAVICFFQLVLYHNQGTTAFVPAENICGETPHTLLQFQNLEVESQRYPKVVRQIVRLCKPGRKAKRFTTPDRAHIYKLNSSYDVAHFLDSGIAAGLTSRPTSPQIGNDCIEPGRPLRFEQIGAKALNEGAQNAPACSA